jgi:hypothetical protein
VGAHSSLGDAQAAGDLGVGVPGSQQAQQVLLPGGEPGHRVTAPLRVQAGAYIGARISPGCPMC